jgi:hypothetical protein
VCSVSSTMAPPTATKGSPPGVRLMRVTMPENPTSIDPAASASRIFGPAPSCVSSTASPWRSQSFCSLAT